MADLNGDGKESIGEKLADVVDGASQGLKNLTGNKFDEQIESVSNTVESTLAEKLTGDNPFGSK